MSHSQVLSLTCHRYVYIYVYGWIYEINYKSPKLDSYLAQTFLFRRLIYLNGQVG